MKTIRQTMNRFSAWLDRIATIFFGHLPLAPRLVPVAVRILQAPEPAGFLG